MPTLRTRSPSAKAPKVAALHHHHSTPDDDDRNDECLQLLSSSSSSSYLPSHNAIVTTRSILLMGLVMYGLHCSEVFQQYYSSFYTNIVIPYGGHRMSEPILAVVSFAISGMLFSVIKACGVKKMKPALSSSIDEGTADTTTATSSSSSPVTKKDSNYSVSSTTASSVQAAITALFEGGGDFVFWGLVINGGVYLLLIDVSQRIAEHELRHLSLIQQAPIDPPSLLRLLSETVFSVCAYDFLFYFIHRSFHAAGSTTGVFSSTSVFSRGVHRVRQWWNSLHLPHHDHYTQGHKPLRPMITFHHHFLDASAQVGINILVQQIPLQWVAMCVVYPLIVFCTVVSSLLLPTATATSYPAASNITTSFNISSSSSSSVLQSTEMILNGSDGGILSSVYLMVLLLPTTRHTLSKLMHNIVVTYLLVEAHSGYDLPFQSHRVFPSIFGGAVRHQIHHGTGRKYFHQFFMYLDDAMGPLKA